MLPPAAGGAAARGGPGGGGDGHSDGDNDLEAGLVEEDGAEEEAAADVVFRDLELADLPALRALQSGLFPVQYNDAFYSRLFAPGFYTLVGVAAPAAAGGDVPTPPPLSAEEPEQPDEAPLGARGEAVVAVASARVTTDWRVAYIMTLGVRDDYRRRGLGSRALQLCLDMLLTRTDCVIAQLHVKTLNTAAVAFYNRHGWVADEAEGRGGLCSKHYMIDGIAYDALALKLDLARMRRALGLGGRGDSYYAAIFEWSERTCNLL
jgi:ribosomal protein S18 acetylase RimI-like enzyme